MLHKRCFIDFDRTLYDTNKMNQIIFADLISMGYLPSHIMGMYALLIPNGYSFEKHLSLLGHPISDIAKKVSEYENILSQGDTFLFPGVTQRLNDLIFVAQTYLLTHGYPPHQRKKFENVSTLRGAWTGLHYTWNDQTKGDIIQSYGSGVFETWFIDDQPAYLLDVQQKAPWAECIRIMWPNSGAAPHPADNRRWPVVTNFSDFVTLVES